MSQHSLLESKHLVHVAQCDYVIVVIVTVTVAVASPVVIMMIFWVIIKW